MNHDNYIKIESDVKITTSILGEEAKDALKRLDDRMLSAAEMEFQGAMQEKMSKEATGIIDVSLDELRLALANMDDQHKASKAAGLLGMIEEHSTIKGKKAPVYHPLAELVTSATERLLQGSDRSMLDMVLKKWIFMGSKITEKGGLRINEVRQADRTAKRTIDASVAPFDLSIDPLLDTLVEAADNARNQKAALIASGNQMSSAIKGTSDAATRAMEDIAFGGQTIQSGMVNSGRSEMETMVSKSKAVANSIFDSAGAINRKMMGPVALGLGAAFGLAALLGGRGYSPTPLESEMPSPQLKDAMASGRILEQKYAQGNSVDQFQNAQNRYAMMDRPINVPATYMSSDSAYATNISAQGAPGAFAPLISAFRNSGAFGSTSVSVNDRRRPITSNYLDRLLGDY